MAVGSIVALNFESFSFIPSTAESFCISAIVSILLADYIFVT